MIRAVCLMSGGLDSTVCLYHAKATYRDVLALWFDYGQSARDAELAAAVAICHRAEVPLELVSVPGIFTGAAMVTDVATYVPGRNLVFLAMAASRAAARGFGAIVTGICRGQFDPFPDCTAAFADQAQLAIRQATRTDIAVDAPLVYLRKEEVLRVAARLDGCIAALALSRSCYADDGPCGECLACIERAQGFARAGLLDPAVSP